MSECVWVTCEEKELEERGQERGAFLDVSIVSCDVAAYCFTYTLSRLHQG
jgi:hypothetical protein